MGNYIKRVFELDSIENSINCDFNLVTTVTDSCYLEEDFKYNNNNSIYELDTRLSNYNQSVNEDFYNFNYEYLLETLNDINKDNYFSIIEYKGKRFFIIENYFLVYEDYNEGLGYRKYNNKNTRKILALLIETLEGSLLFEEVKSLIYNELNIGNYDSSIDYHTYCNFDNNMLIELYDNELYDVAVLILDKVDFTNINQKTIVEEVKKAYISSLNDNIALRY